MEDCASPTEIAVNRLCMTDRGMTTKGEGWTNTEPADIWVDCGWYCINTYHSFAGNCWHFSVSKWEHSNFKIRNEGGDFWGGNYVNIWFLDGTFRQCSNPSGGKIPLGRDDSLELICPWGVNE